MIRRMIGKLFLGDWLSLFGLSSALMAFMGVAEQNRETSLMQIIQVVVGLIGFAACVYVQGGFDGESIEKRTIVAHKILFLGGEASCLGFFLKMLRRGVRDFRLLFWIGIMLGIFYIRILTSKPEKRNHKQIKKMNGPDKSKEKSLEQLESLKSAGLIDDREYQQKREEILRGL